MSVKTMCLFLIVSLVVVACASGKPNSSYRPPSGMGIRHAGDLVFVSKDKIVLRYGEKDHAFFITEKTKLLAPIDALKPGDKVSVLTTVEDEKNALEVKRGQIEIPINIESSLSATHAQMRSLIYGCQCGPGKGTSTAIQVKVERKVLDEVASWDKRIWFFTSKDAPLKSFDGLQAKDVAAWGIELTTQLQKLCKTIGITDTECLRSVRTIKTDNPIFSGMENSPRLFVTWSGHESELKGAIRIELIEGKHR